MGHFTSKNLVIAVGSKNPVKINAAKLAFSRVFSKNTIKTIGYAVESGVAPQPMSDEETMLGAANRAMRAAQQNPYAAYHVGFEGGIATSGGHWFIRAWVAILGKDGKFHYGSTQSFALPQKIVWQIQQGKELGEIIDALFDRTKIGTEEGYFGIMTNNLITRTDAYRDACIVALIQTLHPDLFVVKSLEEHYPQGCICENFAEGLIANDCHKHNENPLHFDGDGTQSECDCDEWQKQNTPPDEVLRCDMCQSIAVWVRSTQFSGDHLFCDTCARKEENFGERDSSYFFWEKIK